MRVLHVNNPAGAAGRLADAQRAEGAIARVLSFYGQRFGHPHDLTIPAGTFRLGTWSRVVALLRDTDAVHFHDCLPMPFLMGLRAIRRRVVFHHHGSIARSGKAWWARIDAPHFVSTPDLVEKVPGSRWLPTPSFPREAPPPLPRAARFLHVPTDAAQKGTPAFDAAIVELQAAGRRVEYRRPRPMPHARMLQEITDSSVVLDQWAPAIAEYGITTLEAAESGRYGVALVSPTRHPNFPRPAGGLVQQLHTLADPDQAVFWGERARAYARVRHDPHASARMSLDAYERAPVFRARTTCGFCARSRRFTFRPRACTHSLSEQHAAWAEG